MNFDRANFSSTPSSCDRQADVHRYHDGELDASDRLAFESHLIGCFDCQSLLAQLREVSQRLSRFRSPEPAEDFVETIHASWATAVREEGVRRLAGWMTAAAAAVLIGAMFWSPATPKDGDDRVTSVAMNNSANWAEAVAVMPPSRIREESSGHLVQVAQWMANDLQEQ